MTPVFAVVGLAGVAAILFTTRPWDRPTPPAPTPVAVAPTPTPTSEVATPEPTPTVEATPEPTPTATVAATPAPTPAPTKVAIARGTPKPTGTQPGAKFGARASPDATDPKFLALEDGHRQMDVRRLSAAVAKYKSVTETYPAFPDGHYWFGYASAMEGDAKGACTGFKRYSALAPKGYYVKNARQQAGLFCAATE